MLIVSPSSSLKIKREALLFLDKLWMKLVYGPVNVQHPPHTHTQTQSQPSTAGLVLKVALIRSDQFPLSLLSCSVNTKRQRHKFPRRVLLCNFM